MDDSDRLRGRSRGILGPLEQTGDHVPPAVSAPVAAGDTAARVVEALQRTLGAERVVTDPETLRVLAQDMLRRSRAVPDEIPPPVAPLAAVLPRSTDEVAAAVRVAAAIGVPIVELGGGTGLMGGARSTTPGIVLDLRTLNRVLSVSREDRTAHAEAGVVLADLGAALDPHELVLGHDPWTVPIATVGGTISTNGLGYLGARYGSMGDQVLGLTVVLADGSVVRTRPMPRSSTGPRLRELFIGAEGTLGIITEAVLRVFPHPEARQLASFEFEDFDAGWRAVQALFERGITPALVDFGQTRAGDWDGAEPATPAGAPGLLHVGFEGLREEVSAVFARAETILREGGGRRLPQRTVERFWRERHVVAEEIRARRERMAADEESWPGPGLLFDFVHVALPPSRVLAFKRESAPLLTARGISIGEWGLWNQPELFSLTLYMKQRAPEDRQRFAGGVDAVLRLAQELGGSMEYCHGAGLRLAHLMEAEHGSGMALLRALKHALDPADLLNRGKLDL